MTMKSFTREFEFEAEDTCKQKWTFTLHEGEYGLIVDDLVIEEREQPKGCHGHPKTIMALIKGAVVDAMDDEILAEAGCARGTSCGQILAKCLKALRED